MGLNVSIFNNNFEKIEIIDRYQSLIWTDKYCGPGDFELYMFYFEGWDKIFVPGYYLKIEKTENRYMIIEDTKVEWDYTGRSTILITGRSLESILDRRIVLVPLYYNLVESDTVIDNDYVNIIKYDAHNNGASISRIIDDVITQNCIKSSDKDLFNNTVETHQSGETTRPPYYHYIKNMSYNVSNGNNTIRKSKRNIDNLIFYNDYIDSEARYAIYHTVKPYNIHFENISVLEAVQNLCNRYQIGFKIEYKKDEREGAIETRGQMVFFTSLYVGEDKSENITFSPILDNVLSTSITNYNSKYKNVFIFKTQNGEELPMGDYEDYRVLTGLGNGMLDINYKDLRGSSAALGYKDYFCKWWTVPNLRVPYGLNLRECFSERYIKDTYIGFKKRINTSDEYKFEKFDLEPSQIKANTRQDDVKFIIDQAKSTKDVDIKIDPNNTMYKLGEDYKLGDVVGVWIGGETVEKMRITAITHIQDEDGYRIYPTFEKYIDLIINSDDAYRVSNN